MAKASPSCTSSDPSYLYWGSNGETQAITLHDFYDNNYVFSDSTNNMDYTMSPNINNNSRFYFKQIESPKTPYADYLRYGESVYMVQHMKGGAEWYATGSEWSGVFYSQSSPNCSGIGWPNFDWCTVFSQTESNDGTVGVKFDDPISLQLYPCGMCQNPSPNYNYLGGGSPGQVASWQCSPLYHYAIHDTTGDIPTQQFYSCCGGVCEYASSPSGDSCSSCLSTCGVSGTPLPLTGGKFKQITGTSSLPLASCIGAAGLGTTAVQTYTFTTGEVSSLQLLFVLGEDPTHVTTTVPSKVDSSPSPGTSWMYAVFSYDASDGSATVTGVDTISWEGNKTWENWALGCGDKTIQVTISMRSLSINLGGTSQDASFIDLGYASGLYCNLYGAQGTADDAPRLQISGKTSAHRIALEAEKPHSLADNWWWVGIVGAGLLIFALLWFTCIFCKFEK